MMIIISLCINKYQLDISYIYYMLIFLIKQQLNNKKAEHYIQEILTILDNYKFDQIFINKNSFLLNYV